ncbi:MAG: hypothetical protein R3C68_16300 [Myxococcota bacterium]
MKMVWSIKSLLDEHTEGYAAVCASVAAYTPAQAQVTGVPAEDIEKVAIAYARTRKAGIYYTWGLPNTPTARIMFIA